VLLLEGPKAKINEIIPEPSLVSCSQCTLVASSMSYNRRHSLPAFGGLQLDASSRLPLYIEQSKPASHQTVILRVLLPDKDSYPQILIGLNPFCKCFVYYLLRILSSGFQLRSTSLICLETDVTQTSDGTVCQVLRDRLGSMPRKISRRKPFTPRMLN
jgi:hypothetical protein